MGQYLHLYESESAFTNDYNGEYYHEPWVSLTKQNGDVNYNKRPLIERVWELAGNSGFPLPPKVMVFNGSYHYTMWGSGTSQFFADESIATVQESDLPFGQWVWYDFTSSSSTTVYDANDLPNNALDGFSAGSVSFLWEVVQNDWPDEAKDIADARGSGYVRKEYYSDWEPGGLVTHDRGSTFLTKIDGTLYVLYCYGD